MRRYRSGRLSQSRLCRHFPCFCQSDCGMCSRFSNLLLFRTRFSADLADEDLKLKMPPRPCGVFLPSLELLFGRSLGASLADLSMTLKVDWPMGWASAAVSSRLPDDLRRKVLSEGSGIWSMDSYKAQGRWIRTGATCDGASRVY